MFPTLTLVDFVWLLEVKEDYRTLLALLVLFRKSCWAVGLGLVFFYGARRWVRVGTRLELRVLIPSYCGKKVK